MILYRALQPILQSTFGAIAFVLKHTPKLRESTEKLWKTWEIRYISGRPAFYSIDPKIFKNQKPIWIHAASGEFEYAKSVIREIRKSSDLPILVTYFSPTFAENVRKFPGVTASCALPLDSRDELEAFFDHFSPSVLLIARTDAWPNCVLVARRRKTPVLLFSATFTTGSKRVQGIGKTLTRQTLQNIDQIHCVSLEDVDLLEGELGLKNAIATGDTRYDQVLCRLSEPRSRELEKAMVRIQESILPRAFVAGSVWPEDLRPVIHASFKTQNFAPHTLVLVPHEISKNFTDLMRTECRNLGFKEEDIRVFSELESPGGNLPKTPCRVLIVDKIGLLAELYLLGEIAFVGGSFRKTVHSVMEPLAAGDFTIVGPYHTNNREAIEFQSLKIPQNPANSPSFVSVASGEAEFVAVLGRLWREIESHPAGHAKKEIRAAVAARGGATKLVLRWLESVSSSQSSFCAPPEH